MIDSRPSPRRELVAVAILTAIGAILRLWGAGRLGLTHFDEGIYALAGLWIYAPTGLAGLDPMVIPYAPPGVPILTGLAYFLGQGPTDTAALAVSLVAGILTIPVVAWVGRRTFGPGSGAAAGAFAAISGPHLAFSRMALTDASFLLAWLVALGLGGRFLERPRLGRALAFGLAVGVAQNVKYHGWLAGAIVALAAWPAVRRPRRELLPVLGHGLIAASLAGTLYLPWVRFVQGHGGYAALVAHQRSYLGGLASWVPHLRSQLAQAVALSGGWAWGLAACVLAASGASLAGQGGVVRGSTNRPALAHLLAIAAIAAALVAVPEIPWWIGVIWAPLLALDGANPSRRVLGVGFVVLYILTPFYHPYARLWLPLHAAGWLVLGGIVPRIGSWIASARFSLMGKPRIGWRLAWSALAVLAMVHEVGRLPRARPLPGLLAPTDDLRSALELRIIPAVGRNPSVALHALVRPSILFYLTGWVAVRRYGDLSTLTKGYRPGDFVLIDRGLLDARPGRYPPRLGHAPATWHLFSATEGVPTSLDEDPDRAIRLPLDRPIRGSPEILLDFLDGAHPVRSGGP